MPMRRADRAALVSLFQLLGGPHWLNNDGWDVDGTSDPCDHQTHWRGVGCIDPCDDWRDGPDCYFGRVTALNLRNNNLTGSMTHWKGIGDLHNLTWLDLSFNSISGSVPAEIGEIQNIVIIHLGARIPGLLIGLRSHAFCNTAAPPPALRPLMSQLCCVQSLTHLLCFYSASFSLTRGFFSARVIGVYRAGNNGLQGQIPTSMGHINSNSGEKLTELNMERNSLEGTLPSSLGLLNGLRMLQLGFNAISGSIPWELTNLTEAQVIHVQSNHLEGSIPEDFGTLQALRYLNLTTNNISGTLPPSIGNLRGLVDLSLSENRLTGSLPLEIGSMFSLRHLRMHTNGLDGNFTALTTLGDLRNLVTLDLYGNRMHGDVPSSIQNLSSLQYLYLDNQHYAPLRQYYCGQRLPNNGKYNYRIVRDEYLTMTSIPCDNMHDTNFAFSSLQESGVYPS